MNKAYMYLKNILSITLIFLFITVFVTENTNLVNNNYRDSIITTIENNINLDAKIGKIEVKWNGLTPKVLFHRIVLTDKNTKKIVISGEKFIVSLNLYDSIINNKIIPKEFNIVKTNLRLSYRKGQFFFKNKNIRSLKDYLITDDSNKNNLNLSNLNFRITDSSITLKGIPEFPEYKFKNIKCSCTDTR